MDLRFEVQRYLGVTLRRTGAVTRLEIARDPRLRHRCELFGPWGDENNQDVRLFVVRRELGDSVSLQLLVQDKDDDVFLNPDAEGTEHYVKYVTWRDDG